jgi:hypothetical protein
MPSTLHDPDTGEGFPFSGRAEIGYRPPKWRTPFSQPVTRKVRHHSVTGQGGAAVCRAIQAFHMDHNGWSDIAYNYLWTADGQLFEGRGLVVGGATEGANAYSVATCFIGNSNDVRPSARGFRALRALEKWIDGQLPGIQIEMLHSDFTATACPGEEITTWHRNGSVVGPPNAPGPKPPPAGGKDGWKHQQSPPRVLFLRYRAMPKTWLRGKDVAEVQFLLNVINGMEPAKVVAVDGIYGPGTSDAVRRFQATWNVFRPDIAEDGSVGDQTRSAMAEVLTLKGIW